MKRLRIFLLLCLFTAPAMLWPAADTLSMTITIHNVSGLDDAGIPTDFRLHAPYPNPFNPSVTIQLDIPEQSYGVVRIFDVQGREVAQLFEGNLQAGTHEWIWNGGKLATGIYLVRVTAGEWNGLRKMILLK
ncbi:MAG: T9SS type A sorting domain-containing protein [Candidatus Marinimicrobia bacterium]|nr:T9SS type A sorting domain-containing protein [Candidatus Neomarinimicrobiota bacterium]